MNFKKNIVIGNLKIAFSYKNDLKNDLSKLIKYFPQKGMPGKKLSYQISFNRYQDKSLKRNKSKTLNEFVSGILATKERILAKQICPDALNDSIVYFAGFKRNLNYLKKNRSRLIKDFLFQPVNHRLLILIDKKNRKGKVFYSDLTSTNKNKDLLLNTLKYIVHMLITQTQAIFLHCAALKLKDKGYVFIAKGGGGKSTISKLILKSVSNSKIISDDEAIIVYNNKHKKFYVCQTFFNKKINRKNIPANREKIFFPLDKLFFIHKSKSIKVTAVNKIKAFKKIMSAHLHNQFFTLEYLEKLTANVLRLLDIYKLRRLKFAKNKEFLKLIF